MSNPYTVNGHNSGRLGKAWQAGFDGTNAGPGAMIRGCKAYQAWVAGKRARREKERATA